MLKNAVITVMAMLCIYVTDLETVRAAPPQTEINLKDDARRIVEKVFQNVFFGGKESPQYKDITVDEAVKKITVLNAVKKIPNGTMEYGRVEIVNYSEDQTTGAIGIGQLVISDYSFLIDENYLKTLKKNKPDDSPLLQNQPNKVTIGKLVYSDIKLSERDHYLSIKEGAISGFGLSAESPFDFSALKISLKGFEIRKLDEMRHASEKILSLQEETAKFSPEISAFMIMVYDNFSVEEMVISGLPEFPGKNGEAFKISEIHAVNVRDGVFGEFSFRHLNVTKPDDNEFTSGKFESISLQGLKISDFLKYSADLRAQGIFKPDPDQAAKFIQFMEGFSFHKMELSGPNGRFSGNFSLNWGKFVGLFPTKIILKGDTVIDIPEASRDEEDDDPFTNPEDFPSLMRKAGLETLDLKFEMGIDWDETKNSLVLSPFIYDADKIFTLSFSGSLEKVTREMLLEQNRDKLAVMALGATVGPITLELTDKGIQKMYEAQAKGTWEGISAGLATDPALQPVVANITRFVTQPKGKVRIVLKPKSDVTIAQLSAAAMLDVSVISSLFDIETTYTTLP